MRSRLSRFGPLLTWSAAIIWTGLVCLLMLLPGEDTVAEDVSGLVGGTSLTDAAGHVIMYAVLAGTWQAAFRHYVPDVRALWWAVLFGLALGVSTELGQVVVPHRGSNILDLMANMTGVGIVAIGLPTVWHYRHHPR